MDENQADFPATRGSISDPWSGLFFDPGYVGCERAVEVGWLRDAIHFRGAYFDILAHVEDIVDHKVHGFIRWDLTHVLVVKVRGAGGIVQTIPIGGNVADKWEFVEFLKIAEGQRSPQSS